MKSSVLHQGMCVSPRLSSQIHFTQEVMVVLLFPQTK